MRFGASTRGKFARESIRVAATGLAKPAGVRFAGAMLRLILLALLLPMSVGVASARDSLGVFEGWGAFRDAQAPRCYAIAEPVQARGGSGAVWRPFAAIGHWPRKNIRGQFNARLSRQRAANSAVTLSIGDRRFRLVAGNADVWAPDRQTDAAIIATMRSVKSMSIEATDQTGRGFADTYDLRGVATAMDAAALGCAK